MTYEIRIAAELDVQPRQVKSAIELLDDGNTIPFIARYRKERTLSLDELQLRKIQEKVQYYRAVDERRDRIVESILSQEKMTDELHKKLQNAETLVELEDLYLPYKPKRSTRASKAIDAGLEPLAILIFEQPRRLNLLDEATRYVCDSYPTIDDVLSGGRDIVAQVVADDADIRRDVRQKAVEWGVVTSTKIKNAEDERETFKSYYEFSSRIKWVKPYQILALNRGEAEKVLRVRVEIDERDWLSVIQEKYRPFGRNDWSEQLNLAIADSAKRLLLPAVERELRRNLTGEAHEHAIAVFAENVKRLLLQPPLIGHTVLGIDPGFRTGCKVAVVDPTGNVLETTTIYPTAPQFQIEKSTESVIRLIKRFGISLIVIGNGTASRETEQFVADLISENNDLKYLIVNEAGASVYSASAVARQEFPDMDVSLRGAISIARRAQDPLAELVKIDPQSIGVGLYQHDVDQNQLSESLAWVVESVVNQVGVDLNTASSSLLKYVSGISEKIANEITTYRTNSSQFTNRNELLQVKGLGAKTFEQAAGFLRIRNGDHWLDSSAIHPESYDVVRQIGRLGRIQENADSQQKLEAFIRSKDINELASELGVGVPTMKDIIEQIQRPGRDPRDEVPAPVLRSDILRMEDLREGMKLAGTVRNVVDFGAFVDIGVKQDGLLHISKMPRGTQLSVGDVIDVQILSIDEKRGRIGFSME